MFGQNSIPIWTGLTAIAGLLQVVVLIVTARFVWRYLQDTAELRRAAERQIAISIDQLEAQTRPAIVVRPGTGARGVVLVNVGRGAAVDVILSAAPRGDAGSLGLDRLADDEIPFIAAGKEQTTSVRTQDVGIGGVPVLNGRSLQCQYKSLSGRVYWTVVDFDHASGNTVIATRYRSNWESPADVQ